MPLPDFTAGQILTASALDAAFAAPFPDGIDEWTPYTPVWASSGTQPVLGNGTLAGRYWRIGPLMFAKIQLQIGSTSTMGTGFYTFSLPHPVNQAPSGNVGMVGGWFRDVSTATDYFYQVLFPSSLTVQLRQVGVASNVVWGATTPVAPATSDFITVGLFAELL